MTINEIQEDRANQIVIDALPNWGLATLNEVIHECEVNPLPDDEASNRVMTALYRERDLRHDKARGVRDIIHQSILRGFILQ